MEPELLEQWRMLERRATRCLGADASEAVAHERGVRRLFYAGVFPSFEDAVAYDVFGLSGSAAEADDEGEASGHMAATAGAFALRRLWRREQDAALLWTPDKSLKRRGTEPTVEAAVLHLEGPVVRDWHRALGAMSVPLVHASASGIDGTTFVFALGDYSLPVVIRWWQEGPPAWAPLTAWLRLVLAALGEAGGWREWTGGAAGRASAWLVWRESSRTAEKVAAVRRLVPALRDTPVAALAERAARAPDLYLGTYGPAAAMTLQERGRRLGLRVELREVTSG